MDLGNVSGSAIQRRPISRQGLGHLLIRKMPLGRSEVLTACTLFKRVRETERGFGCLVEYYTALYNKADQRSTPSGVPVVKARRVAKMEQ